MTKEVDGFNGNPTPVYTSGAFSKVFIDSHWNCSGRATGAKQNKNFTYLLTSQAACLDPTERAFIMFSTIKIVIPLVLNTT